MGDCVGCEGCVTAFWRRVPSHKFKVSVALLGNIIGNWLKIPSVVLPIDDGIYASLKIIWSKI